MFESLRIRNYRVFDDLEIRGLRRINLIAGGNNAGKTSFLEAVFLLSSGGNPQMAVNTNVIRGPDVGLGIAPQAFETAWKHMFHDLNMERPIKISGRRTLDQDMTLQIKPGRVQVTHLPLDATGELSPSDTPDGRSLSFRYTDLNHSIFESHLRLEQNGIAVEQANSEVPFTARIILGRPGGRGEGATMLARLRTQKQGHILLDALRAIEPRLESIEDSMASGMPAIWGDIGLPEMIPLDVMGDGMIRLANIVLGISSVPGGIVLIDEVENGIHHSVMPKVWEAVSNVAEQFGAQVFATTHSFECVQAVHKALGSKGFRYFRLDRTREGGDEAVVYSPRMIETAISRNMEIR